MSTNIVCHMLIGPPGSGKSTLAHRMQQVIPDSLIISTDQIRHDLYGDVAHQGQWSEIETLIHAQIKQALVLKQSIIYDATNAKRIWRMGLLQDLAALPIQWVGWHLTTDLSTCYQWNCLRDRKVPDSIIQEFYANLQQFPPCPAEGFAAIYSISPTVKSEVIVAQLSALSRRIINRANRTQHGDIQLHRYSSLLAFDRLLHLVSLLVHYPGLGHLSRYAPEQLQDLLGKTDCHFFTSLDEVCAVLTHQHGAIYADPHEIAQDIAWLEANGFLSPKPEQADLVMPPHQLASVNPHPYTDWDAFKRLLMTIRFITHYPLSWDPEQCSSLKSLVTAMQQRGLLIGDRAAVVRKDIEQVLKPFGILPPFRMRRGYFIGTGILSERELLRVASLLQAQAKNIQDPAALSLLETLQERLHRSQHDLVDLYPVRAIGNRTIINPKQLPTSAIAQLPERLEAEIEAGQLLELKRFAGVGRFGEQPDIFFRAWPLQIVFHNIAWYLGYEIAEGSEAGLLQFERLDRLFRGRSQPQQRELSAQRNALQRLQQLYRACGGLYLGSSAKAQQQFLSRNPTVRAAASIQLELWFTDRIFSFISEGTQRFPTEQMKMSPKLAVSSSSSDSLFSLPRSEDPEYPNRLEIMLPQWSIQDWDLRRWILGFGAMVKVISPLELVDEIRRIGCGIADLYSCQ